jgi:hypothetical protein
MLSFTPEFGPEQRNPPINLANAIVLIKISAEEVHWLKYMMAARMHCSLLVCQKEEK